MKHTLNFLNDSLAGLYSGYKMALTSNLISILNIYFFSSYTLLRRSFSARGQFHRTPPTPLVEFSVLNKNAVL